MVISYLCHLGRRCQNALTKFALISLALMLPLQAQATISLGCHGANAHQAHQVHQAHQAHQAHAESRIELAAQSQVSLKFQPTSATQDSACLHCAGCCPGFAPHGQMIQIGPFMASIAPAVSTSRMALKEIPQGLLRPPR